jgi:hypothetical protein
MRRTLLPLLAVLAALLAAESPSRAANCCGATAYSEACCPQPSCYPTVRYRTCYQTVVEEQTRTCYRMVPRTVMKEVRETVCKPVYDTTVQEFSQTVCRPVWEEYQVPQTYHVCKPVYSTEERSVCETTWHTTHETCYHDVVRTVRRPVCEMRTVTRTVREWRTEQYCAPGRRRLKLIREEGACKVDPCTGEVCRTRGCLRLAWCEGPPQVKCRRVCCPRTVCEQVPCTRWVNECVTEKVPVTVCKRVPVQTVRKVPVTTCKMVREECTRMVTCRRCKMVPETVVKKVPVTTCRMVSEEVCRQVPVTVCERVPYCVTEKVCRRVPVQVPVCECEEPCFLRRLFSH